MSTVLTHYLINGFRKSNISVYCMACMNFAFINSISNCFLKNVAAESVQVFSFVSLSDITTLGCDVTEDDRVPCGPNEMSDDRCIEYGCCYDDVKSQCYHNRLNGGFLGRNLPFCSSLCNTFLTFIKKQG